MEKRRLWIEHDLNLDGYKYVQVHNTISIEEYMRFFALLNKQDMTKQPFFDTITRT